jgi:hypothetical protein
MSPNGSLVCPCGHSIVIIYQGHGLCSFCLRSYSVEATWAPAPKPKPKVEVSA